MAFDGSGVFNRLYNWQADAANDIAIMADRMDNEFNGIATGLSLCLTRTGQAGMLANLSMGNFRITSLGAGTAVSDAVNKAQMDAEFTEIDALFASVFEGGSPTNLGTLKPSAMPAIFGTTIIENTMPQLQFNETDQVDPAGRFRFRASAAAFWFEHAATAAWATVTSIFTYNAGIFTIAKPLTVSGLLTASNDVTIAGKLDVVGDISIKNSLPVLWLQDTDATLEKNWALWTSSNVFRLGRANTSGTPDKNYIAMFDDGVLFEALGFKIQNTYPTISFADTTPSGEQYLNLSAGNGWWRFSTANSDGTFKEDVMTISPSGGIIVQATTSGPGDFTADGMVTGALRHRNQSGYVQIGAYSSTYGSGYGNMYWDDGANKFVFQGAVQSTSPFIGSGANLTDINADQITTIDGGVGCYRWLLGTASGDNSGAAVAGSSLKTPYLQVNISTTSMDMVYGSGPSGTWECMQSTTCAADEICAGMWLRIA